MSKLVIAPRPKRDNLPRTLVRRTISISMMFTAFILMWLSLPLWLPLSFIADLIFPKRRFACCRFFISLTLIVSFEILGILLSPIPLLPYLFFWDKERNEKVAQNYLILQCFWAGGIFGSVKCLYGLKMRVINQEKVSQGPMILLLRHCSIADVLLGTQLVAKPYKILLRYVMKSELRWDPCIDIVAPHMNCLFVDRFALSPEEEIEKVGNLARNLRHNEGVLLYPEGTRFTKKKKERILDKLQPNSDAYAYAKNLSHVLPPKLGGILRLLEINNNADVVFCAHTGLEGMAKIADFWDGKIINRTIKVYFWRVPFQEIPSRNIERKAWLLEQWQEMDHHVDTLIHDKN